MVPSHADPARRQRTSPPHWRCLFLWLILSLTPACFPPSCPAAPPGPLPLFRQALEQWEPDAFEVILFHRGPLSPTDDARRSALEDARRSARVNASFRAVDLEGPVEPALASVWERQVQPQPPWIIVRSPAAPVDSPPLWASSLHAPPLDHLFDSPARRRLAEGLLQGATAIWILLECGEPARDEAAVDILTTSLRTLEKQLRPPNARSSASPLPLRIDFGLLRVTRNDPAEDFLVTLLEDGRPHARLRPQAFPVFGRGRTLEAIAGREIDLEAMTAVAKLLTSPLPGTIATRPGRDLLLGADWNRVFQAGGVPPPAPPAPPQPAPPASPAEGGPAWPLWLRLSTAALLATVVTLALRRGRPRQP